MATYSKWKQKSNFPTARGNSREKKLFNLVFLVPYPKAIICDIYYQVICTLYFIVLFCASTKLKSLMSHVTRVIKDKTLKVLNSGY